MFVACRREEGPNKGSLTRRHSLNGGEENEEGGDEIKEMQKGGLLLYKRVSLVRFDEGQQHSILHSSVPLRRPREVLTPLSATFHSARILVNRRRRPCENLHSPAAAAASKGYYRQGRKQAGAAGEIDDAADLLLRISCVARSKLYASLCCCLDVRKVIRIMEVGSSSIVLLLPPQRFPRCNLERERVKVQTMLHSWTWERK